MDLERKKKEVFKLLDILEQIAMKEGRLHWEVQDKREKFTEGRIMTFEDENGFNPNLVRDCFQNARILARRALKMPETKKCTPSDIVWFVLDYLWAESAKRNNNES